MNKDRTVHTPTTLSVLLGLAANCFALGAEQEPGLLVRLYDIGEEMRWLPELVPGQLPNEVKVVPTVELRSEKKDFGDLERHFLTEVAGQLDIQKDGGYTFRLISKDGAKLWIDGRLVVDHDGAHGPTPKDGRLELTAGTHDLRIWHFNSYGGAVLTLHWEIPAPVLDNFKPVPAEALSHRSDASRQTAPGKKKIIPPLRRGRPGDGTPVPGAHPAFAPQPAGTALPSAGLEFGDGALRSTTAGSGHAGPVAFVPGVDQAVKSAPLSVIADDLYGGQVLIGTPGEAKRASIERSGSALQGAVFRFAKDIPAAGLSRTKTIFEMLAVRAFSNGFEIEFTKTLDPRCGWDPESYYVEQWPFDAGASTTPHRDGVVYPVKSASVLPDRRRVFLEIPGLKTSHVVYIRLLPPCISEDGELPWSTEAWYTLNVIPQDRTGQVLTPPAKEPQNMLTEDEKEAGWRLLFDGQTSRGWHGWKQDRFPEGWQIKDGCIVRVARGGDIATDEEFDNFELALEWRISPGGNSGIFFRSSEDDPYKSPWETGPEMQVLDNAEHPDGQNPKTSAASNYALHAPLRDVTQPVGFFNRARIIAANRHVEYWLNDVKVVEYELGSPEWEQLVANSKFKNMPNYGRQMKGRIVLQDHGDQVWYRNIKIRPLR